MKASFYTPAFHQVRSSSRAAFTLIEMMIVVGIISILLGMGVYYMSGSLDYAKDIKAQSDLSTISMQLKTYEMQNQFLPSAEQGLDALVNAPQSEPLPLRWHQLMTKLPNDPWGRSYLYRYPGIYNTNSFDVYTLGADGIESSDDIGNWDAKPTQNR